ncbi:hypothetical protein BpHYR1_012066 [Brachionus plicatilis]|uniref:Uncharacterized protein n=1 Tax=Brachionus plicatilis TaxID=10195 RepID=A0A3M7SSF5_BRAPC|nr:hypothetical protein BpHYR1_012066 [Brachionus plicatilis]
MRLELQHVLWPETASIIKTQDLDHIANIFGVRLLRTKRQTFDYTTCERILRSLKENTIKIRVLSQNSSFEIFTRISNLTHLKLKYLRIYFQNNFFKAENRRKSLAFVNGKLDLVKLKKEINFLSEEEN